MCLRRHAASRTGQSRSRQLALWLVRTRTARKLTVPGRVTCALTLSALDEAAQRATAFRRWVCLGGSDRAVLPGLAVEVGDCGFAIDPCGSSDPPICVSRLSLTPSPPRVLRLYAGSVSLGNEVAMSLRLAKDTTHLDHSLESPQQRVLGFAFTYLNF